MPEQVEQCRAPVGLIAGLAAGLLVVVLVVARPLRLLLLLLACLFTPWSEESAARRKQETDVPVVPFGTATAWRAPPPSPPPDGLCGSSTAGPFAAGSPGFACGRRLPSRPVRCLCGGDDDADGVSRDWVFMVEVESRSQTEQTVGESAGGTRVETNGAT